MCAKIQPVSFAVLKTADPPYSDLQGKAVSGVQRFGKFVSMEADGLHFVFHLARAGWVRFTDSPTDAQLKMGKGHIALRLTFSGDSGPVGMDLTEAGTKKSLSDPVGASSAYCSGFRRALRHDDLAVGLAELRKHRLRIAPSLAQRVKLRDPQQLIGKIVGGRRIVMIEIAAAQGSQEFTLVVR